MIDRMANLVSAVCGQANLLSRLADDDELDNSSASAIAVAIGALANEAERLAIGWQVEAEHAENIERAISIVFPASYQQVERTVGFTITDKDGNKLPSLSRTIARDIAWSAFANNNELFVDDGDYSLPIGKVFPR